MLTFQVNRKTLWISQFKIHKMSSTLDRYFI